MSYFKLHIRQMYDIEDKFLYNYNLLPHVYNFLFRFFICTV